MKIEFNKKQLKNDKKALKAKGISKDVAEHIAQFRQIVEFAFHFEDYTWFVGKEDVPEEFFYELDNARGVLEDASERMQELFMTNEEIAKANPWRRPSEPS